MSDYKQALLPLLVANRVLSFGSFTLKSGRESPYFFTSSRLHSAPLLHATAAAYASVLSSAPFVASSGGPPAFDIIFGPAYKGIPICAAVTNELAVRDAAAAASATPASGGVWDGVSYAFNRKEAKTHGEGGSIVGAPLRGKRVVIVDDVITAGTAVREAIAIIEREGGVVAGVVVLLDREERVSAAEPRSAVGVLQHQLGRDVPVRAVLALRDLIDGLSGHLADADLQRLKDYRARYGATA